MGTNFENIKLRFEALLVCQQRVLKHVPSGSLGSAKKHRHKHARLPTTRAADLIPEHMAELTVAPDVRSKPVVGEVHSRPWTMQLKKPRCPGSLSPEIWGKPKSSKYLRSGIVSLPAA